jgi:hypothetical protein
MSGEVERIAGISGDGREAERRFCKLTGATPAASKTDGDAVLHGEPVEIKKTSSKHRNLNQVRAYKYLPLVVWVEDSDEWYVIPAHEVVAMASKLAPMHSSNPFECVRLGITRDSERFRIDAPEHELEAKTLEAIRASAAIPELHAEMRRVRAEAEEAAKQARVTVQALLRKNGIG